MVDDYRKMRRRFNTSQQISLASQLRTSAENMKDFFDLLRFEKRNSCLSPFHVRLPIGCYEPLSVLQRLVEQIQCCHYFNNIVQFQGDPTTQLAHLAAFVVSSVHFSASRMTIPFEPIEGETFEFCWKTESVNLFCNWKTINFSDQICQVCSRTVQFGCCANTWCMTTAPLVWCTPKTTMSAGNFSHKLFSNTLPPETTDSTLPIIPCSASHCPVRNFRLSCILQIICCLFKMELFSRGTCRMLFWSKTH